MYTYSLNQGGDPRRINFLLVLNIYGYKKALSLLDKVQIMLSAHFSS